jgi:hypothetical protein
VDKTAHNRTVYASPLRGSGYEKPQSAYGLCAVFLRHILTRRNATHCFMGGPKRRKQPERYAQLLPEIKMYKKTYRIKYYCINTKNMVY